MAKSFRQQFGIFSIACAVTLSGCASDGSLTPSAQSRLVTTCNEAQTAVTVAGFFQNKMNAFEIEYYLYAQKSVDQFCSPSAIAAYATPDAEAAAIAALGKIIQNMNAVKDAAPVTNMGNPT